MGPEDLPDPESTSGHEHSPQVAGGRKLTDRSQSISLKISGAYLHRQETRPATHLVRPKRPAIKTLLLFATGTLMVATASIVVANSVHLPALSTGLAVVATITTGFSGMIKFQEHWIRYRSTATALEVLKLRYEVGTHPFD